ncbi:glyoxalase/bleomycin resistance/extradiol dioxygenase family protein [Sporosarcina oncorhynchi]|uniref:Glyoxalase/bleomycin resistance/extradiol dioxygenase family protein n=1 Tax=Sporosarcina oncorhynchi TaxID=3056444 RepID=A0ABZ0L4I9_9BACL|nr:glyoxalase/bleomycin resistance/extradiol dioxygenase family protein [Sporosarcina sp. T2O-4]WOV86486.1 glyoxalase/bleomycin resistance/extradiol dioxygenase family protein [Sporosarcina sp. T2O-4]
MAIDIYLTFNGNCREAVEFYAEVFDTEKPKIMTFGENPPNPEYPLPEEAKNLVMHTRLDIDGSNIMFSDTFPGSPFTIGNNISIAYHSFEADKLQNVYDQLKEGGTIGIELQETFWAKLYGQVTDKFGVIWQFNLNSEDTAY